ncbi:MAG: hypothetical protein M0P55_00620 [Clostridiales bacterium]|nr:hypothetical protein [Clostridiales bacterium]
MALSFLSAASVLVLCIGFFLMVKSETTQNAFAWIFITITLLMCWNALSAGLMQLVNIPVNLASISMGQLLLSVYPWYKIIKSRKIQKYTMTVTDVVAWALVFVLVAVLAYLQFGDHLRIQYETSDPSIHMSNAKKILNNDAVGSMYFMALNNALLFEFSLPFVGLMQLYRIFILSDIFMLFLSGVMFYTLIHKHLSSRFMKIFGISLTLVYVLGYPHNNMVFGFVYLGACITLTGLLLILIDSFVSDEMGKPLVILMLNLCLFSIFVCYMLFAPIVYIAAFICLGQYYFKKKRFFTFSMVGTMLLIFLVPFVLGAYYTFVQIFLNSDLQVSGAMNLEGYIYRDLYTNFVFFIPLTLYGLYRIIKDKTIDLASVGFVVLLVFMIGFFVLVLSGNMSTYYFYKNHFLLWLLVLYLAVIGALHLQKQNTAFVVAYSMVWILLAANSVLGIDERLNKKSNLIVYDTHSQYGFEIFTSNRAWIGDRVYYPGGNLDLYYQVIQQVRPETEKIVQFAGEWYDCYWFMAITDNDMDPFYNWILGDPAFMDQITNGEYCDYFVVIYNSDIYRRNQSFFDQFSRIYENGEGFIAKAATISGENAGN